MTKPGRNDPCPCGSGKKFKKCCENLGPRAKFQAQVIDPKEVPLVQKARGISSQFFANLAMTSPRPSSEVLEENDENK